MQDHALIQRHLHRFEFAITSCFLILFRGSFLLCATQFRRRQEKGLLGTVVYLISTFLLCPGPRKSLFLTVALGSTVQQFEQPLSTPRQRNRAGERNSHKVGCLL